jgi:hypothetical protein
MARRQGARWAELRASVLLGRFLHDKGRREEAKMLVQPIYDWFTEGRELQTMVEARALIDEGASEECFEAVNQA